jgi:hypothetical protein
MGALAAQEDPMHLQIVMDTSGDTRHQFDPEDTSAVADAERRFRELTGAGSPQPSARASALRS